MVQNLQAGQTEDIILPMSQNEMHGLQAGGEEDAA